MRQPTRAAMLTACLTACLIGLGGCVFANPPVDVSLSVHRGGTQITPARGQVIGSAVLGCSGRPDGTVRVVEQAESGARGVVVRLNDGSPSLALVWLQQGAKGARIGDERPGAASIPLVGIVKRDGTDWILDVATDLRPGVDLPISAIAGQGLLAVPGAMSVAVKGRMPALSARNVGSDPALGC